MIRKAGQVLGSWGLPLAQITAILNYHPQTQPQRIEKQLANVILNIT